MERDRNPQDWKRRRLISDTQVKHGGIAQRIGLIWTEGLLHWTFFSVIIAMLPFVIHAFVLLTRNHIPTVNLLFSNGELLIVSSAITADAIGSLFTGNGRYKRRKIIVGCVCIIILILSSAWFGIISTEANEPSFNMDFAARGSIVMFIIAIIASGACMKLAESGKV